MLRTIALTVAACAALPALAQPLTPAFTYQGRLLAAGGPAAGPHDLRFALFSDPIAGLQVGPSLCADNLVPQPDGSFTTVLDFGAVFAGQRLYLQIQVRADTGAGCADATGFTTLTPRQELSSAPYAAHAVTAGSAASLGGQPASFYSNASNLSTGTIPDARLAPTVARTDVAQTFTAAVSFSNAASSFTGSGAGLTALNASSLASGTVPDTRLPASLARTNTINFFAADQSISGNLRINAATSLAPLHVGGDGYFTGAVRVGHTTSPRAGTIRFNSSNREFEGYNGAWWASLTSVSTSPPTNIATFSTPGTTTWTVPAGVNSIGIEVWGGGGGGGASGTSLTQDCGSNQAAGGSGGGSGGYALHIIDVTPGEVFFVTVGNGGNGGSTGSGTPGGTSSVSLNAVILVQATGGGQGAGGGNQSLGSNNCASLSASPPGAGGVGSLANFSNQPGNPGLFGRRAYNTGGCGLPPPNIVPGCAGGNGAALASISPSAASAGAGGSGGTFSGGTGPGQSGAPGRVRILY
jgi:hypothetical protein